MDTTPDKGLPVQDVAEEMGKTLTELVSLGCKFVVEGDLFLAVDQLLDKLMVEAVTDTQGLEYLGSLQTLLRTTAVPVMPKVKEGGESKSKKLEIVGSLAGLPKPPVNANNRRRHRP